MRTSRARAHATLTMTSLIFGAGYLAYKKTVDHKHNKRKQKNYERWEGLREEMENERRLSLDDRAAIFQRKERNSVDRPQRNSLDNFASESQQPPQPPAQIEPQRTAARTRAVAWDDELPAHLNVTRRNFNQSPTAESAQHSEQSDISRTRSSSEEPKQEQPQSNPALERIETPRWETPGGKMAELIEMSYEPHRPARETNSYAWLDG